MISVWLLLFILSVLFTPLNIVILLYLTAFGLFTHKLMLATLPLSVSRNVVQSPYLAFAHIYVFIARWWHGYSVKDIENIPRTGPALLVFYHAPMPFDMYYLNAHIIIKRQRRLRSVGDRFLSKIPGISSLFKILNVDAMTADDMCRELEAGHVVAVSPGGVREALFSDDNYSLVWNKRIGFAKVVVQADCSVPIIPIFAVNGREAFRPILAKYFRTLYERTRFPVVPVWGGLPVKITTIVGKPINFDDSIKNVKNDDDPDAAAKLVAKETAQALENLIRTSNQRFPPSILAALSDRFS